jgi:hypothetical protein
MSWSARLPLEASVHSTTQCPIAGVVVVRVRGAGPVVFATWRDGDRKQVMRRLGPAWVVPQTDPRAKPRGARIGDFVEQRGRAPEMDQLVHCSCSLRIAVAAGSPAERAA